MNSPRFLAPGPAQRAASEIRTTINDVAADVRQMSAALDELRSPAKSPLPAADRTTDDAPAEETKTMKLPAGDQQESTAPESRLAENRTVTPSPEVHDDKRPRQSKNVETPPLGMDAEEVAPARDGKPAPRESAHQGESAFPRPAAADRPVPGPAGASAVHVPPPTNPPQLVVVPPVPDLRPQFEVFMNTVVCNQQLMIDLLQDAQQVLNAHATQISELRRQIERQQNTMSNLRRF